MEERKLIPVDDSVTEMQVFVNGKFYGAGSCGKPISNMTEEDKQELYQRIMENW